MMANALDKLANKVNCAMLRTSVDESTLVSLEI